jgi:hypothetical protein
VRHPVPTKPELYKQLHELADRYFNGPYRHPESRESIGRELRSLILTIELRENLG